MWFSSALVREKDIGGDRPPALPCPAHHHHDRDEGDVGHDPDEGNDGHDPDDGDEGDAGQEDSSFIILVYLAFG